MDINANILSYVNCHQESITENMRSMLIHICVAYLGDVSLGKTRSPSLVQTVFIYGKCPQINQKHTYACV